MKHNVFIVVTCDGGKTVSRVELDPTDPNASDFEKALAALVAAVSSKLNDDADDSTKPEVPDPAASPDEQADQYAEAVEKAINAADGGDENTKNEFKKGTVVLTAGDRGDSVANAQGNGWDILPGGFGASIGLEVESEDSAGNKVKTVDDGRLQKAIDGDCEYYVNVTSSDADSESHVCRLTVPTNRVLANTAEGLWIEFTVSPTRFDQVRVIDADGRPGPYMVRQRDGSFLFSGPLSLGYPNIEIDVAFAGDRPFIRAATVLTPAADDLQGGPTFNPAKPLPKAPPSAQPGSENRLGKWVATPPKVGERLNYMVGVAKESKIPTAPASCFFHELDHRTNPIFRMVKLKKPKKKHDFDALGASLTRMAFERAKYHHFGKPLHWSKGHLASHIDDASNAGALVLKLMSKYFHEDGTGSLAETRRGFDSFCRGVLTLEETFGAPNGTNFFAFAELALVLWRYGCKKERDQWGRIFRVMGYASDVFARCYHQCGGPRTFCAYGVEFNPGGVRGASIGPFDSLWLSWLNERDPVKRYAAVVHASLLDEIQVEGQEGTVEPIPLPDAGCARP